MTLLSFWQDTYRHMHANKSDTQSFLHFNTHAVHAMPLPKIEARSIWQQIVSLDQHITPPPGGQPWELVLIFAPSSTLAINNSISILLRFKLDKRYSITTLQIYSVAMCSVRVKPREVIIIIHDSMQWLHKARYAMTYSNKGILIVRCIVVTVKPFIPLFRCGNEEKLLICAGCELCTEFTVTLWYIANFTY